jgi:glycosyltransferase involved in cell wall biosynthesis
MKLVLHAPNVHQGGGASLLAALLRARPTDVQVCAMVDDRFSVPASLPAHVVVHRFPSTLRGRLLAEWRLRALAQPGDVVLCFGNLPPLFPVRSDAILFLQNRHLVERVPAGFPHRMKLRLLAEKSWLRTRLGGVQRVLVQTPTMQRLVQESLGVRPDVAPFHAGGPPPSAAEAAADRYDFLYVSSGGVHKNHTKLIEAWILLAQQGLKPHLCLTLSERDESALCRTVAEARREHAVRITNAGSVALDRMGALYAHADAFIFPSVGESFGLPLLEATTANLPILAPEADYVRDVVDPVQTFDATSAISIARAVKRHLGVPDSRVVAATPAEFLLDIVRSAHAGGPTLRRQVLEDGPTQAPRLS